MIVTARSVDTNSKRVCAVRISADKFRLMLICVYMPHEGNSDMTDEFVEQLGVVDDIIAGNQDCHVVVGGDFNVDFGRDRLHTTLLNSFCDQSGLHPATLHSVCDIDYTYNFNMCRFNILDHFILSGTLYNESVNKVSVLHDSANTSDHDPILLRFALECRHLEVVGVSHHVPKVSWDKATTVQLNDYRHILSLELRDVELPKGALLCYDVNCSDVTHFQAINSFADSLISACIRAADLSIPHTCVREASGRVPGWTEHVQPLRDKSMFWHKLWIDGGRPKNGARTPHTIMP